MAPENKKPVLLTRTVTVSAIETVEGGQQSLSLVLKIKGKKITSAELADPGEVQIGGIE